MKSLTLVLVILILSGSAHAQTPDNDALFGTFNVRNDAARIRLATNSPEQIPIVFSSMAFDWSNGPLEEILYRNDTWGFGYNADFNGTKVVPGVVSYMFSNESKYRNGVAGEPGAFMTEHHFNWASPDNSIAIRPLGFTVQYDTGNTALTIHGQVNFFRNFSNGGAEWGIWHDDGFLDLRSAPNGVIAFKNNGAGVLWGNAAGTNTINPVRVDSNDRVLVGGGQQETVITSAKLTYANPQCGAIPDSSGSAEDNARAINSLLACMRGNGQIAQGSAKAKSDLPICVGDESILSKPPAVKAKLHRGRIQR